MANMRLDLDEEETKGMPWDGYDFSKPSLALIAADEHDGVVLWTVGGHVNMEMKEAGLRTTEDLGITPPKPGIWVWEGKYVWVPGPWEYPQDGDMDPVGTHRAPTEEEWAAIREGRCPWDDRAWKTQEYLEEVEKEKP